MVFQVFAMDPSIGLREQSAAKSVVPEGKGKLQTKKSCRCFLFLFLFFNHRCRKMFIGGGGTHINK